MVTTLVIGCLFRLIFWTLCYATMTSYNRFFFIFWRPQRISDYKTEKSSLSSDNLFFYKSSEQQNSLHISNYIFWQEHFFHFRTKIVTCLLHKYYDKRGQLSTIGNIPLDRTQYACAHCMLTQAPWQARQKPCAVNLITAASLSVIPFLLLRLYNEMRQNVERK